MGVRRGGGKMGISPPENWDYKNQKFRENRKSVAKFRLIDVILLICRYDTHTVRCSGVMQWWACSSVMSALPAEAGCKTFKRIVVLLVFIA